MTPIVFMSPTLAIGAKTVAPLVTVSSRLLTDTLSCSFVITGKIARWAGLKKHPKHWLIKIAVL